VAAALVKFVPAALVPLFLVAGWQGVPRHRRWRFLLTTTALSVLLVIVSYAPFWEGGDLLGIGRRQDLLTSSAPALLYLLMRGWLGRSVARHVAARWALAGFGLLVLRTVRTVGRAVRPPASAEPPLDQEGKLPAIRLLQGACVVLLGYLLAFCPWFWPWYLIWVIPLVALLPAGVLRKGVVLFSFTAIWKTLLLIYWKAIWGLPDYHWRQIGLVAMTLLAPWLYYGYHRLKGSGN
jgi:hypothetical protein